MHHVPSYVRVTSGFVYMHGGFQDFSIEHLIQHTAYLCSGSEGFWVFDLCRVNEYTAKRV